MNIRDHEQVWLVIYADQSIDPWDEQYKHHAASVYEKLQSSMPALLATADNDVRELADSYDAEYRADWTDRLKLKIVRIYFDSPIELFFESHSDPIKPALFHGLDLYLTFDKNWNPVRAWFDG